MRMQFKKRERTDYIYVVKKLLKGATLTSLFKQARRAGEFDTGYHYIMRNTGELETDRSPADTVAQYNFPDNTVSLYILADCYNGKLSDAQKLVLSDIAKKYPDAEIKEVCL